MSRFLARFRLLLPPSGYLGTYIILYLLCNLPAFAFARGNQGPPPPNVTFSRKGLLIFGLLAYGAYRTFAFHPFYRAGYRKWLESTPWDWRKPLPVGPVRPVWEDILIVGVIAAPAWYFGDIGPFAAYSIPLGAYLMALSGTLGATGAWGFHVAVAFVVGLALRLWDGPEWQSTGAILLGLAFGLVGLGRSLKRWPWEGAGMEFDPTKLEATMSNSGATANLLGWPFDRVGPRKDPPTTWKKAFDGFFGCLLAGWWLYAVLALLPEMGRGPVSFMVLFYVTLFTMVHRLGRYLSGYQPPLSLGGRLRLFRPIVWSYDQVVIAPIAALFAVTSGPWMLNRAGLPWDAASSIALAVALLALVLGGPDRTRWQLTARTRVVPAINGTARTKGGFVQVG